MSLYSRDMSQKYRILAKIVPIFVLVIACLVVNIRLLHFKSLKIKLPQTFQTLNNLPFNAWPLQELSSFGMYGLHCTCDQFYAQKKPLNETLTGVFFIDCFYLRSGGELQKLHLPLAFSRQLPNGEYANFVYGFTMPNSRQPLNSKYAEFMLQTKQSLHPGSVILAGFGLPSEKNTGLSSREYLKNEITLISEQIEKFQQSGLSTDLGDDPIALYVHFKP